jgi:4-diphosphocytidyl-2-C-methyl-D-erythritol kinase
MRKTIRIKSPAKVNLFLEVLGKRRDGYHELNTVMQEISLCDILEIKEQSSGIAIQTDSPDLADGKSNLIYKAADLFKKHYKINKGVHIKLTKKIPIGGGLGGGSSNAAYTLKGLNLLWNMKLSEVELAGLAAKLGSDVPFFIYGGTALCKGRGEIVFPMPNPPKFHYIVIFPGFSIPTKKIYKKLKNRLTKPIKFCNISSFGYMPKVFNRLEKPAFGLYPKLKELKEKIAACGLKNIVMSGSGSCLFVILKNRKEAERITGNILKRTSLRQNNIFRVRSFN